MLKKKCRKNDLALGSKNTKKKHSETKLINWQCKGNSCQRQQEMDKNVVVVPNEINCICIVMNRKPYHFGSSLSFQLWNGIEWSMVGPLCISFTIIMLKYTAITFLFSNLNNKFFSMFRCCRPIASFRLMGMNSQQRIEKRKQHSVVFSYSQRNQRINEFLSDLKK